jgi:hypothetical protein
MQIIFDKVKELNEGADRVKIIVTEKDYGKRTHEVCFQLAYPETTIEGVQTILTKGNSYIVYFDDPESPHGVRHMNITMEDFHERFDPIFDNLDKRRKFCDFTIGWLQRKDISFRLTGHWNIHADMKVLPFSTIERYSSLKTESESPILKGTTAILKMKLAKDKENVKVRAILSDNTFLLFREKWGMSTFQHRLERINAYLNYFLKMYVEESIKKLVLDLKYLTRYDKVDDGYLMNLVTKAPVKYDLYLHESTYYDKTTITLCAFSTEVEIDERDLNYWTKRVEVSKKDLLRIKIAGKEGEVPIDVSVYDPETKTFLPPVKMNHSSTSAFRNYLKYHVFGSEYYD